MARRRRVTDTVELTAAGLKGFVPEAGREIVWDAELPGFGLRTRGNANAATWKWVYSYRQKGSRTQVKLTLGRFLDLSPAKARKAAEEAAGVAGSPNDVRKQYREAKAVADADKARPTVERLWTEYRKAEGAMKRSERDDEQRWRDHLKPWFGNMKVAAVTSHEVEKFKASMAKRSGACNRSLALLSRMMTLAVKWGYRGGCVPEHPVKGVTRYPETQSEFYFHEEDLGYLLKAADELAAKGEIPKPVALAVRMLAVTGARVSEVMGSHWGQFKAVDEDRLLWKVEGARAKGGRPISRSISGELAKRLLEWKPISLALTSDPKMKAPERWVFPQALRPELHVVRIFKAWAAIKDAARTAAIRDGLEPAAIDRLSQGRIHDLRHTAGSLIVLKTGSLAAAQFQLGHATPLTTRRYAHLMPKGMQETGDLMATIAKQAEADAKAREKKVSDFPERSQARSA
jgi:integrase